MSTIAVRNTGQRPLAASNESYLFTAAPAAVLLLAVIAERLTATSISTQFAGWPFLLSLVLLGLPHGAVDWWLGVRSAKNRSPRHLWISSAVYLSGMLAMLTAVVLFPLASVIAFGLMSAFHFGQADERDINEQFPASSLLTRRAEAIGRGGLVLSLPFATWPRESVAALEGLIRILGGSVDGISTTFVAGAAMLCATGTAALWLGATFTRLDRRNDAALLRREAVEMIAIIAAFGMLHPLFAMGLYFVAWHSWRHWRRLVRLPEVIGERVSNTSSLLAKIAAGHARSSVLLIPTLMIFAALAVWRVGAWEPDQLALLAVAIFIVVTPSHDWLVRRTFDAVSVRPRGRRLRPDNDERSREQRRIFPRVSFDFVVYPTPAALPERKSGRETPIGANQ